MKMFGRSGGYWLFWTSAIYFVLGTIDVFFYDYIDHFEYIEAGWLFILSIPLWVKPMARWLNMKTLWE